MTRKTVLALPMGILLGMPLLAVDPPTPMAVSMSAPRLGYVFDDSAKAIQEVLGVPGAASLGNTVSLDTTLQTAWVNSRGQVAAGTTKEGKNAVASWSGTPKVTVLDSSLGTLTQVAFSASGAYVALSDGSVAEVWSHLDGVPTKSGSIHPDSGVAAIAASAAGDLVVATGSGVILKVAGDAAPPIAAGGQWTALAFAPNGDLLAVDGSRGELARLTADGSRSTVATLPGAATAIVVSADGTQAAVVLTRDVLVARANGDAVALGCDCDVRGLTALNGNLVVYLTGTANVLDADSGDPRLTVLPNLSVLAAGGSAQ